MTQTEFLTRMADLYATNLEISRKKNSDYASETDPFLNFRACETYGISCEKAIVVRMSDKLVRVANLLDKQAQVVDESLMDSLSDLTNYAMILRIYIEQKK